MAIWQYNFIVVPRKYLINSEVKVSFDKDGFLDDETYWLNDKVNCDLFGEISTVLPKAKPWHKDLTLFGRQDSNCFEVYSEYGLVESVSFRIDFTTLYKDILDFILEFLRLHDFLIIDEQGYSSSLDSSEIKMLIENSKQFHKYKALSSSI
ncbi:hypothetical protein [Microscilla marina]|uniref:Uncharacterized protein n=1 Tax=Microscilla marina ATCC 23134 TaxID=313606 RepID=A1ZXJ6_MICM2|nr:hypothetical protein [Microscilla marina]EAY24871.1 hypothetical protein M23134_05846 [Microscilla marina ATCC 23134]